MLYKRGKTWWTDFTFAGRRVQESCKTKDRGKAEEYEAKLKSELWRTTKLGERPEYTWPQAAGKWLQETYKSTVRKDEEILAWLDTYLNDKPLTEITRALIVEIRSIKAKETSQATANRYMALVRAILRKAVYEWDMLDKIPKVPMFPAGKRRVRWISREIAEQLLHELPEHQSAMARFALCTGLRQRNVCRLEWTQLDMPRKVAWIHPDQAKARKAISVPLNAEAIAVLHAQIGKHQQYVFTYKGRSIWQVNTKAWRNAVKKVGLTDFRWHDLRHTWASWHVQAGTPDRVLQELGGWESTEMVRRYAHLGSEHLSAFADNIDVTKFLHLIKEVKKSDVSH